jgi:hypothetical protein
MGNRWRLLIALGSRNRGGTNGEKWLLPPGWLTPTQDCLFFSPPPTRPPTYARTHREPFNTICYLYSCYLQVRVLVSMNEYFTLLRRKLRNRYDNSLIWVRRGAPCLSRQTLYG